MAASAADRNLLFGLLALQNGLIDQGQLVSAFQAWTRAKHRLLADHLLERGGLDVDDRAAVEALVERHLKKHGDDAERSLAVIPASRSVQNALAQLDDADVEVTLGHVSSGLGRTEPDGDADQTATVSVGSATSDGQRFQVLRPHAKGGLGAVFVALDRELNREVALKQILDRHAEDPVSRQRFLLEAEVTGNLEHPGIVPVYGLGTDGNGRPYYAMRFIKGDSLKEAIEHFHADEVLTADPGRRSLELRKLLRCFTDVCSAVDYAHSRGVLHRDIKPANVIVGRHRETLLVDWGLAKALGRSDPDAGERTLKPSPASGSSETLPGSAMGTPAYMSPEQAEGNLDRLGPRSDVYSLGATLYSLLTGQPPFAGDAADVIRAVQRGEVRLPHVIAPSIDRALEAVCMKAMALKPEERYGSARALAEDLERWMADEPVLAWREPLPRRLRRWGRRNRTAVTAGLVAVFAGVVGLTSVIAVQTRANGRLQQSNAELAIANQRVTQANADLKSANDREKQRFNLAMDAIKLFHGEVSEDLLLKEKQFETLRTKLLKGAADFYGRLEGLLKGQTDRASRAALGKAYDELGELTGKIGDQRAALAVYMKALAVRRALVSLPGADVETTLDVARTLNAAGTLQRTTGDVAGARASHEEAQRLAVLAETQDGGAEPAQEVLGTAHHRFALTLSQTGDPDGARVNYRKALAIRQKLVDAHPEVTKYQRDLAMTHNNIALLSWDTGDPAGSLAEHGQALAIRQKLADAHPGDAQILRELAMSHHAIGGLLYEKGDAAGARAALDRALAIRQKLANDNPSITQIQHDLADIHYAIGGIVWAIGDLAGARAAYDRAMAIRQKLVDTNPGVTHFQQYLAVSHNDLGLLLSTTGNVAGARAEYDQALAIRQKLADANPGFTQFQDDLAGSFNNVAVLMLNTGDPAGALQAYGKALAILQKLADTNPSVTRFQQVLAIIHYNIGVLLLGTGDLAGARASYDQALPILQKLVDANPGLLQNQQYLALCHNDIGLVRAARDDLPGSLAAHGQSLAIRRKLADANPAIPDYRNDVASSESNTADVLRRIGLEAKAREGYEQAIAGRERLVRENPKVMTYRSDLASTLRRRGLLRLDQGDQPGALADTRRALELREALPSPSGEDWFEAACCHSALAALARRAGSGIPTSAGSAAADTAMALLKKAIGLGYRGLIRYRQESALDPLRGRADFQLLLMDLAMPDHAFVR